MKGKPLRRRVETRDWPPLGRKLLSVGASPSIPGQTLPEVGRGHTVGPSFLHVLLAEEDRAHLVREESS